MSGLPIRAEQAARLGDTEHSALPDHGEQWHPRMERERTNTVGRLIQRIIQSSGKFHLPPRLAQREIGLGATISKY
jgi:hypothetical protein